MGILKAPSDEETFGRFSEMKASEIYCEIIQYELYNLPIGETLFQIAINKGLFENLTYNEKLLKAVKGGSLRYVNDALEKGADINYKNDVGLNSIWYAINMNNIPMFKLLFNNGATNDFDLNKYKKAQQISNEMMLFIQVK